jgi:beta-N-acetylhexosaminidase
MRKTGIMVALLVCLCGAALAKERYQRPAPVHLDRDGEKWAEKTLRHLSLEEKVGQMLMIAAHAEFMNVQSPEYQRLRDAIHKYHLGGFGLTVGGQPGLPVKSQPYEAAALINQLQRDSSVPLIFAADFERGLSMRLEGATGFPHAMAFGAAGRPEFAERFGRITAQEARAIGVEWNWFPVADVNSNPANPIINTRAFGDDPQQVGDLVAAYIRGARAAGLLTTAKHFPGHGDTDTDSHLGLARVAGNQQRLEQLEFAPFRTAIAAGVDAVLIAHVTVPALDPDPNHVATNSPHIIEDILKGQLGFQGIVLSDALDMQSMTRLYTKPGTNPSAEAAVAAVKAGNDIVLLPGDLDAAYNALLQAARTGDITPKQIDGSVRKILRAKASVGLHKSRLVDLGALGGLVSVPANEAEAQRVADAAVTLVRDNSKTLPLNASRNESDSRGNPQARLVAQRSRVVAVIFTDDVRSDEGRILERQLRSRVPDANIIYVDGNTAALSAEPVLATVDQAERVIAAAYAVPQWGKKILVRGEWRNTVSLADSQAVLLHAILQRAGKRTVVVAMGNPYLALDFPEVETYLCTFSDVRVSEVSAAKALFGEIPLRGRLPVNLPGVARRGDGLERAMSNRSQFSVLSSQ